MKIDVHTHTFPDFLAKRALESLTARAKNQLRPIGDGTLSGLVGQLHRDGVSRSVLCPIATRPALYPGILAEAVKIRDGAYGAAVAESLIPFASIHPSDPDRLGRLKEIADHGILGIKLHPFYQDFVLDAPDHLDLFRCCRDLGLVVQCHCGWDIGFPYAPICDPPRIVNLVRQVPGLKLIAAHLGGCTPDDRFSEELMESDVYLDTAIPAMFQSHPNVLTMMRGHRKDRLLFATDWPWLSFRDGIQFVRNFGFSPEEEGQILGGNAAQLLFPES